MEKTDEANSGVNVSTAIETTRWPSQFPLELNRPWSLISYLNRTGVLFSVSGALLALMLPFVRMSVPHCVLILCFTAVSMLCTFIVKALLLGDLHKLIGILNDANNAFIELSGRSDLNEDEQLSLEKLRRSLSSQKELRKRIDTMIELARWYPLNSFTWIFRVTISSELLRKIPVIPTPSTVR